MIPHTFAKKASTYLAKIASPYFYTKLKNPFFIISAGRSGSTLLVTTLSSHRDIATYPGEANNLWHPQTYPWRYSKHGEYIPPPVVDFTGFTRHSIEYRSPSQIKRIRATFSAYEFVMRKNCFLIKSAMITCMIPFILEQFPEAKFIHIIRDGRAAALSGAKKEYKKMKENWHVYKSRGFGLSFEEVLKHCATSWKEQIEEVASQKEKLELERKGLIHEIQYEEFCMNPHDCLTNIANFMDISPDGFRESDYSHIKSMNHKYKKELIQSKIKELTRLMEPTLQAMGYT